MTVKVFIRKAIRHIFLRISALFWSVFFIPYQIYILYRAKQIRKKSKIKVLFVLAELSAWKTEMLYLKMLEHPRFEPVLGVTNSIEVPGSKKPLIEYLERKGYEYQDLDNSKYSINLIRPDITFYYKPYDGSYPKEHIFKKHLSSLPCDISYSLMILRILPHISHEINNYSWFVFVENNAVKQAKIEAIGKKARNVIVSGLPMQDMLLKDKNSYENPWRDKKDRKRIIYAPHHSFKGTNSNGIEYATFLEYGEYILELAKKYASFVYFAFKPHPTMYPKLLKIWGKEKTDNYYDSWRNLENAQVELGDYVGLFMHSDAMIHDCGSFTAEYHFTHNPVMFLVSESNSYDDLNEFGKAAFDNSYKGFCKNDIEQFIKNVISENDIMSENRKHFFDEYLVPPNGKSACENIIDTIIGSEK